MDKLIKIGSGAWGTNWANPFKVAVNHHSMVKTASDEEASKFHPRIREYLDTTPFSTNDLVLVVTPLGCFEVWGSNVNGDGFEEKWLEPEHEDWGHKSFEKHSNAFQHHQNKVPEKGFGRVPVSVYDRMMGRVEAVFRIDREKAERVGAGWVPRTLDRGDLIDLSMGANVPWDECSICANKAKSQAEYCSDLKLRMNQVLPDGRIVFARNPYPKFFDLSFVIIRAAKEADILQKVASAGLVGPTFETLLRDYREPRGDESLHSFPKVANKLAAEKNAEIEKHAPVVYSKLVHPMYRTEEPLSREMLDELAEYTLPEALAATATTGIVLRPREFQYLFLCANDMPDMARDLLLENKVFDERCIPSQAGRYLLDDKDCPFMLLQHLLDWIPKRSVFQPFISRRIIDTLAGGRDRLEPETSSIRTPMLNALATEYAKYINSLVRLPSFLKSAMLRHGEVFDVFAGSAFDPMAKLGSFKDEILVPATALAIPTYLLSAKWGHDRDLNHDDIGIAKNFVANHPLLTTVGLLTGYRAAAHRLRGDT